MPLGDAAVTEAETKLNSAARRLLLWKDWWHAHGDATMTKTPSSNEEADLRRHFEELNRVLGRLMSVRSEVKTTVEEVLRFQGSHSYGYGNYVDLYGGCEEVNELNDSLQDVENALNKRTNDARELHEAARRLLAEEKQGE